MCVCVCVYVISTRLALPSLPPSLPPYLEASLVLIAIGKVQQALPLRLVVLELPLERRAVRVEESALAWGGEGGREGREGGRKG